MYKKFIVLVLVFFPVVVCATDSDTLNVEKPNQFGVNLTGFVKSAYWFDSRAVVSAREDYVLLYPAPVSTSVDGQDINHSSSFNYSAIASRIGLVISAPDAFGAKVTGLIEGDFTGVTNVDINGFRLRHAYGKLEWKSSELLLGQFWHPMFVTQVFPGVVSLNTGAPFQPFIRNPQVSFRQFFGNLAIQLALVGQRDNSSPGPDGFSPSYLRNSMLPNIHLQMQYKSKGLVFGVAADFKRIKPKNVTDVGYITKETLDGWSFMGYGKFSKQGFSISSKIIVGQNLTEHLMLGGYAISSINYSNGAESFTPSNHLFSWCDVSFGRKINLGLFAGYAKNFGTSEINNGTYYGRGHDIDYMFRISPRVGIYSGKSKFAAELEHTVAAYGAPNNKGVVLGSTETSNTRLLLAYFLFF